MKPKLRWMLERPGFGICTTCLTEKPEAEMQRPGKCRVCYRSWHLAWSHKKYGPPRTKLTDEELAARAATRQKARCKTGWSKEEYLAYKAAKNNVIELTKGYFFPKLPKRYSNGKGKWFDTEFERDEYARGWREYKEWCDEHRDDIKRAAKERNKDKPWSNKRLRNMRDAGFFSLEAYDAWKAGKPHPRKKSEEHHVERRRIRDQWRNYRKQVKAGMAANGGRIPSGWFAAQLHRQSHCCAICGHPFGDGDVEIDHIVPVAKGGPNVAWNLQLTHPVCNIKKSDLMPWELPEAA